MGLTKLKVGEVGMGGLANLWKLIHWPESMVEQSDSSHSGIVGGVKVRRLVGLEGAEAANMG